MKRFLALLFVLALMAAPAFSQITFNWTLSSDDKSLAAAPNGGYRLYQSQTSGSYTGAAVATVAPGISTLTLSRPAMGSYFWVLRAFTTISSTVYESANSDEVTTTVGPAAPTGLTITTNIAQLTNFGATLNVQVSKPARINFYFGPHTQGFSKIVMGGKLETKASFPLTALTQNTIYCYRINATDATGKSTEYYGAFITP